MEQSDRVSMVGIDENVALRALLEGTAKETGERFFEALVENLARALGTYGAWVSELVDDACRLRALAFWLGGEFVPQYEYDVRGTPCEPVISDRRFVHVPEHLVELYPEDEDLRRVHAVSYMGVPLRDHDGRVLGNLAVLDTRPMPEEPRCYALFHIFAARACAELQRLRMEAEIREREAKLRRLIEGAMDAIVEVDEDLRVTLMNPAAEALFGRDEGDAGRRFDPCLAPESHQRLLGLMRELSAGPGGRRSHWVPGGLTLVTAEGERAPAEATLSLTQGGRQRFYTLILRDERDRIRAEQQLRSLSKEAEYLREELRALRHSGDIIGRSDALLRVLRDIDQVAATDASVLILGETGTGKELVAQAIHRASRRTDRPLVRVNCAAIPASLMESEFFGHEAGAFTGATKRREGRFALADGGTIFLDEIGELSLELQAKLLRVLQDGEFEPVGSSRTCRVNVRIVAATNRDLAQAAKAGDFREDLYYRISVFPIELPPLRARGGDVCLLAEAFLEHFSRNLAKPIAPLTEACRRRLRAYPWPGNVRELRNVIERAVITSTDGRLNLDRALPESETPCEDASTAALVHAETRVRTSREMLALERDNVLRALETARWRVSGPGGAADLLDMKPSTLHSRMKALDIRRPAGRSGEPLAG